MKVLNDNFIYNRFSEEDDDILPPHQPRSSQTPVRQITQKKPDYEFLTPISYITGLQNLNSASKVCYYQISFEKCLIFSFYRI